MMLTPRPPLPLPRSQTNRIELLREIEREDGIRRRATLPASPRSRGASSPVRNRHTRPECSAGQDVPDCPSAAKLRIGSDADEAIGPVLGSAAGRPRQRTFSTRPSSSGSRGSTAPANSSPWPVSACSSLWASLSHSSRGPGLRSPSEQMVFWRVPLGSAPPRRGRSWCRSCPSRCASSDEYTCATTHPTNP